MSGEAYGHQDDHGRVRCLTMSKADAARNARLNGWAEIVVVETTDRGTVPATGAKILRREAVAR